MNRKPRQLKEAELRIQIEKLLSKNPKTRYNVIQISRKINVANPPESIRESLQKLILEKKVVQLSEDRYKWELFTSDRSSGRRGKSEDEILYSGVVDMTRSGAAYIINSESVEDIYVHARNCIRTK